MTEDPAENLPSSSPESPAVSPATSTADPATGEEPSARQAQPRVFGKFGFWIVVFPFIVYLLGTFLIGYVEDLRRDTLTGKLAPGHHEDSHEDEEEVDIKELEKEVDPDARFFFGLLPLGQETFPYTYPWVILVTTGLMIVVGWGYFRVPFRIHPLSFVVGAVGVVVWIGLAYLDRNILGLSEWLSGGRPSFNPFDQLEGGVLQRFLAIRFFGLVVVVPIVEEFFIRGFLIRYVDDPDWDEQPLGQAKLWGWLSPTIYGLVAHMTEPLAALAWFSMISVLYKKTGSIWDCVVAHAVTNLLLGIYIVTFGAWWLW